MAESPKAHTLDILASLMRPCIWSVAAGTLAGVITIFMPNHYRSEVRLLPVESKGNNTLGGLASTAAAFGLTVPNIDGSDANFVDVVNSRWLRTQLLETEFHFHTRSWRFGAEKPQKKRLLDYLDSKNMDEGIRKIGSVLSVSRDLKSKVISITTETTSPELSYHVVQQAASLLETFNREKTQTRGGAKAAYAGARLVEGRKGMDDAEAAFCRFLEANRNYQASGDPAVRLRGTRLEAELRLRQQLVTSMTMNREQALLEEKNDIPILNVLDPGHLPIEKSKPARVMIVLQVMILVGASSWLWLNRVWVRERVYTEEDTHHPSSI